MLPLLTDFRESVLTSRRLITAAHLLDATGLYVWPEVDRFVVVEAAFLKVFVAWETLQERAFVEFLMGSPSATGNIIHRFVQPIDRQHAATILLGNNRYVEWSNHEYVKTLSRNFLRNGDPFVRVLSSIEGDLRDIRIIRNALAHVSSTTSTALNGLASRRLGRSVSGMSAGSFLLSADPNSQPPGLTVFEVSVATLENAAQSIVQA